MGVLSENIGKLQRLIRSSSKEFVRPLNNLMYPSGMMITSARGKLDKWAEHFKTLLNQPSDERELAPTDRREVYDINSSAPSKKQVAAALNSSTLCTSSDGLGFLLSFGRTMTKLRPLC